MSKDEFVLQIVLMGYTEIRRNGARHFNLEGMPLVTLPAPESVNGELGFLIVVTSQRGTAYNLKTYEKAFKRVTDEQK